MVPLTTTAAAAAAPASLMISLGDTEAQGLVDVFWCLVSARGPWAPLSPDGNAVIYESKEGGAEGGRETGRGGGGRPREEKGGVVRPTRTAPCMAG